ncbi:MAG TPA: hypothetical protein VFP84_38130, partial [Kofleriaceae bacterium]|nr:hypothetical protein [Kofleriaceae bacterium]
GTGGVPGVPKGDVGGNGAQLVADAVHDAQDGGSASVTAGGGGGGAGRIWLRYRASSPAPSPAVGAPLAVLDPTLP